jgi:hypothetical protein
LRDGKIDGSTGRLHNLIARWDIGEEAIEDWFLRCVNIGTSDNVTVNKN